MQPLQTNRQVLRCLCIYPVEEDAPKWKRCAYIGCYLGGVLVSSSFIISSVLYGQKFLSIDVSESMFGLYQSVGVFNTLYMALTAFFLRDKITAIIEELNTIYKKCKYQMK